MKSFVHLNGARSFSSKAPSRDGNEIETSSTVSRSERMMKFDCGNSISSRVAFSLVAPTAF